MKVMKIVYGEDRMELSDAPEPQLRPNQVLIDIVAVGANRADLRQVAGLYPAPEGWPNDWPGLEVSGVIADANGSTRWKKGDKVCALLGGGGYAEKVAVPENLVMPMPEGISFEEAAALPEVFATAYSNLIYECGMKAGDTVFIQAGAGGLGVAAIQLAKAFGTKVITTVDTDEKAATVKALGADVVVNFKKESVLEALKANPFDIALDPVAGEGMYEYLKCMNRGGRWVIISTLGGEETKIQLRNFFTRKLHLMGTTLRSRSDEEKGEILKNLAKDVWPKLSDGTIKPVIYKVLPLKDANEAIAIMKRSENIGKIIIKVN